MRHLQDYDNASQAKAASDYLEIQGVENMVREGSSKAAVWVIEESELERARVLLDNFVAKAGKQERTAAAQVRDRRERDKRPVFASIGRSTQGKFVPFTPGVVLLGVACLGVAFLSGLGEEWTPGLAIVPFSAGGAPMPLDWSQPARLLTPMFMHFGLVHLLFNLMWLRQLGGQVEANHGIVGLVALVVVSAVPGNLGQFAIGGPYFGGMSGVNYGLFGFVWMQMQYGARARYAMTPSTVWLMMGWLLLCATGYIGPIADAAHAIGLAVGLCAGLPAYLRFRRTYETKPSFESGSWADVSLKGWRRFERIYVRPYMPAWFLMVALGVLAYSKLGAG